MSAATKEGGRPGPSGVPWSTDLAVVGAAVVCTWVTWWLAVAVAGADLAVSGGQRVGGVAVALAAGVSSLLAILLLRVLESKTHRALRIWTVLAVMVWLASLLGPLSAPTAAGKGTLIGLHAVVATVLIVAAHRSRGRVGGRA